MMHYQLFSFNSFVQYYQNSRIIHLCNGSVTLPTLFFPKPFLFSYKKDSELFIQVFNLANLTQTQTSYHITTISGLHVKIIKDLASRIHVHLEQSFLGKLYSVLFKIDRNWLLSLTLNEEIRYEFVSSPIESLFLLKRIDVETNKTQVLPISYYTDNQTLIRVQIQFTKLFSTFINDFILDISFKNHTFKLICHIPLFKREFFSLIWHRYLEKELFHFHGLIESKWLRRRRLIDYHYNWNLASFRFWSLNSNVTFASLDPIGFHLNLTNDYLWHGQWAIDFQTMLGNRRELVRFNHKYQYTTLCSHLLFDLHLINSHFDLDFNYYHTNHSVQGHFIKNKHKHKINGYWNKTENSLQLNTEQMKSITMITSRMIKSIIDIYHHQVGILLERTTDQFTNDVHIIQVRDCCDKNPKRI